MTEIPPALMSVARVLSAIKDDTTIAQNMKSIAHTLCSSTELYAAIITEVGARLSKDMRALSQHPLQKDNSREALAAYDWKTMFDLIPDTFRKLLGAAMCLVDKNDNINRDSTWYQARMVVVVAIITNSVSSHANAFQGLMSAMLKDANASKEV